MQAVLEFKGHQYLVAENDKISVDRLTQVVGEELTVDSVLCTVDGEAAVVGHPQVTGAQVALKVVRHFRGKKIHVMKFKSKSNYHVESGHRADLTEVLVTKISV